ncbi:MAG: adenylate/guanylate cyclase domain-containing protein [Rhodospirillales bacterium]
MEQPQIQRRLAAIVAADLAGYSRMMAEDEGGTLERLRAVLDGVVEPAVAAFRGRIVKTTGDGFLAEYGSVTDAVHSAARIQRALAALDDAPRLAFRVGINVGDVIERDGDIFGDGVNVAARLQTLAEPGTICMSRMVYDQVRDADGLHFHDRGEQVLRGLGRSMRVYIAAVDDRPLRPARPGGRLLRAAGPVLGVAVLAALAAGAWMAWPSREAPATAPAAVNAPAPPLSIVVLPFANLGGDVADDYVADGITEDITTDLSRIVGSFVIARNTAYAYKGRAVDVRAVGRELGVRYVLEGSVRRVGDRLRITVQLIDAETAAHLWADRIDTDRANAEGVETLVTGRLAGMLNHELIAAESRRALRDSRDPDAHDLAMRGWFAYNRANRPDANDDARQLFEKALALDPDNTSALIGLAQTHANDVLNQWSTVPSVQLAAADTAIRRVLTLNRNAAAAFLVRGHLHRARRAPEAALADYRRAADLDPNMAVAHASIGVVEILLGRAEMALDPIERALRLSPRDRSVNVWLKFMCDAYFNLGRDDVAIAWCDRSLAAQPIWWAHLNLAALHALTGEFEKARAAAAALQRAMPGYSIARHRNARLSANPAWLQQAERFYEGLRIAGVPEE